MASVFNTTVHSRIPSLCLYWMTTWQMLRCTLDRCCNPLDVTKTLRGNRTPISPDTDILQRKRRTFFLSTRQNRQIPYFGRGSCSPLCSAVKLPKSNPGNVHANGAKQPLWTRNGMGTCTQPKIQAAEIRLGLFSCPDNFSKATCSFPGYTKLLTYVSESLPYPKNSLCVLLELPVIRILINP